MKVFISWSGERSKFFAKALADWLEVVIQACRPWTSFDGVESGSQWFREIYRNLADTQLGIICLTQENMNRPWILFEAGAMGKGLIKRSQEDISNEILNLTRGIDQSLTRLLGAANLGSHDLLKNVTQLYNNLPDDRNDIIVNLMMDHYAKTKLGQDKIIEEYEKRIPYRIRTDKKYLKKWIDDKGDTPPESNA